MTVYRFTVFTPTFQSKQVLHRVYESLVSQTLREFEWVVVDDGSTDGTVAQVKAYQCIADFPIVLVTKPENRGLMNSYNLGIAHARGEFFLPAGHDDRFDADALEVLDEVWRSIPEADKARFSGVTALCRDEAGMVAERFPRDVLDSTSSEMYFRYKIRGEKWGFQRTEILRDYPFPEQYRYAMESAFVWFPIGMTYHTRYVNRALRTYFRDNDQSLSRNPRILYPEGMADSYLRMLGVALHYPFGNVRDILLIAARYVRFSIHAGRSFGESLRQMPAAQRAIGLVAAPIGGYMVHLDRRQGRVGDPKRWP